ncbi:MAG: porphobilinogen synthase [Aquificae bacterium]|nr:porphobilinogen synthase [Aquificota bacterium]
MPFPIHRPRRLRKNENIRRLVRETNLSIDDLVYPIFIEDGSNIEIEIPSMPNIYRYSIDRLSKELDEVSKLQIPAVLLFGIPSQKDSVGSDTWNEEGIIQKSIRFIKENYPNLYIITDVCFCEYTEHGHCGVLCNHDVDNDATLENTKKQVISHAKAGADMVAPSGMMDGVVKAIREALDEEGFTDIPIMAYSAKYASAYYGPFRDAAESTPAFGDRRSYQMEPANKREAIREVSLDIEEGADIVMVKPALAYLDIISQLRNTFDVPIAAYNVSGEYSMVKAAGKLGWIDEQKVILETATAFKRAGADIIITYHAKEIAKMLKEN